MSFQAPISISDAISRMRSRRLLLRAIQRGFVWESQKVEWLFDSLLQGYPIGSFLFWEVHDDEAKHQYKYYEFLSNFKASQFARVIDRIHATMVARTQRRRQPLLGYPYVTL